MGSGQSVPKDYPLACVLKNLKPLLLTELKANHLTLYTGLASIPIGQSRTADLNLAHLTLTFFKISPTSLDGMASGRRSHMPKPFGPFGAGPPYARPALPTRSFCVPCLPNKRALQLTADGDFPHPWSLTPLTSSLPTSHTSDPLLPPHQTHLLTLKPLLTLPQPHYPISPTPPPFPSPLPQGQYMIPLREVAGPEGPTQVHVPFSLSDINQIEEKLGSFSENISEKSYPIQKRIPETPRPITSHGVTYILNATLTPDEKDHIWQAEKAHAESLT